MRRFLFFAAAVIPLLILTGAALAADPVPLAIIVPSGDILPGDDVDLAVTGLKTADMTAGKLVFIPPESAAAKTRLIAQWGLSGLEPSISFRAKVPGDYRLILVKALPSEKLVTAAAVVTVKGDVIPPPPPPPPPGGKFQVVILQRESGRTPEQAAVWFARELRDYLAKQGHSPLKPLDLHSRANGAVVPPELAAVFSDAAGKTLPRLYLTTLDGKQIVASGDPPVTVAAFIALIKAKGG